MIETETLAEEKPITKKTRILLLERIQREIDALQAQADQVKALPDTFDELDMRATIWGGFVDFDCLTHAAIVRVIKSVGGKWDKTPSSEAARIDYQTKLPSGLTIRCWAGEPPPNCRIEEVDEIIPAQPERIEKKKRLVCKDTVTVETISETQPA